MSVVSHNLNRLLNKSGYYIEKSFLERGFGQKDIGESGSFLGRTWINRRGGIVL